MTTKDSEQDELIRSNAAHIARNEEAIRRQTAALELIRDHYYPPAAKPWRRVVDFAIKVLCVVLAYAGGVQAVDWYFNTRKSSAVAEQCAEVAHRLFMEQGDTVGALRFYDKAVALDESCVQYSMERAFVKNLTEIADLFDLGRPFTEAECDRVDAALADATFLVHTEPDDPLPYILAGQAHFLHGDRAAARAAVAQAVERGRDTPQIHISACAIHFMCDDLAEARQQITIAEKLAPQHPLVLLWKGALALRIDHDVAAARACFAEMARRAPDLSLAHLQIGRTALLGPQPDVKAARAAFARALAIYPTMVAGMLGMAETYEREKQFIVARLWLDRALGIDARNMKALVARAHLAQLTGDTASARADLTSALALAPFRADLYRLRAALPGDAAQAASDRATAEALEKNAP